MQSVVSQLQLAIPVEAVCPGMVGCSRVGHIPGLPPVTRGIRTCNRAAVGLYRPACTYSHRAITPRPKICRTRPALPRPLHPPLTARWLSPLRPPLVSSRRNRSRRNRSRRTGPRRANRPSRHRRSRLSCPSGRLTRPGRRCRPGGPGGRDRPPRRDRRIGPAHPNRPGIPARRSRPAQGRPGQSRPAQGRPAQSHPPRHCRRRCSIRSGGRSGPARPSRTAQRARPHHRLSPDHRGRRPRIRRRASRPGRPCS
jgi:hypothetical protein